MYIMVKFSIFETCDTTAFRIMLILLTGYVFGGDVLRLFHGHMDECLAIPEAGSENEFR